MLEIFYSGIIYLNPVKSNLRIFFFSIFIGKSCHSYLSRVNCLMKFDKKLNFQMIGSSNDISNG